MVESNALSKIRKFSYWLDISVKITAVIYLLESTILAVKDVPLSLFIDGELWTRNLHSFAIGDQIVLLIFLNLIKMLWLTVLIQFWRLSRLYRQNKVFTVENARCFLNTGWGLISMAAIDILTAPLIGGYLSLRGESPGLPDMMYSFLFHFDYLVPGILFLLVAKIMEQAALMKEDVELTI